MPCPNIWTCLAALRSLCKQDEQTILSLENLVKRKQKRPQKFTGRPTPLLAVLLTVTPDVFCEDKNAPNLFSVNDDRGAVDPCPILTTG